jgi:hypothetical protein
LRIPDFVENLVVFASELHLDAHDYAHPTIRCCQLNNIGLSYR